MNHRLVKQNQTISTENRSTITVFSVEHFLFTNLFILRDIHRAHTGSCTVRKVIFLLYAILHRAAGPCQVIMLREENFHDAVSQVCNVMR